MLIICDCNQSEVVYKLRITGNSDKLEFNKTYLSTEHIQLYEKDQELPTINKVEKLKKAKVVM